MKQTIMKMNQLNNPSCNTASESIWHLSPRKANASLLNVIMQHKNTHAS